MNSPTGQTRRRIFTLDDSNDADSRKDVPFGGVVNIVSSRIVGLLVYTAIFEKNMRNSTVNYLIPDWLTAVT